MDSTHIKLAASGFVALAAVAYDLHLSLKIKRHADSVMETNEALVTVNEVLTHELDRLCQQKEYLVNLLEEHDVPCTEFDLIVLNNII